MTSLGDLQGSSDAVEMFVTNVTYTENGSQPVVHLYGRDSGGTRVERTVVGHEPHFSVPAAEYDDRVGQHYSVSSVEDGNQSLDSRQTKRIAVKLPKHVGELREFFDDPLEADVLYAQRFLIDTGITTGVRVPSDQRCHVDSVEPCEPPAVDPRVVTLDIEVASDSGFPEPDAAAWPVVSAVAHDNYTDEYTGWILQSDEWDDDVILDASLNDELSLNNASVFDREDRLLAAINSYVSTIRPDILTGWNSNHFDYPYLINRCRELDVWSYQDWSPIGEVYTSKYGPVAKGTAMLDMLGGYEKTQIHKLDDRSLDAIAAAVVGEQKDEIDGYGNVWREDPVSFLSYNHQDTRLVTEIANEAGVIDLFTNIRELSGVSYEDPVGGNFETMDAVFLRRAQEYGYTLPTASKPDRDWYYGAYVFDPEPGLHEHVVYLDVSSLYPSIISMLNISPETIVGYEQPPYAYTKSYVDRRADNVKKDSDPEPTEIYFDDRERGFVPSTVDEMIDLKEQYRGTGMYEATKRITNTVYGFLSDSDSYGKGSRLYDWRMGEAITLAGRKIIQETAEIALMWCRVNGYSDAYIPMGDSVPSDEVIQTRSGIVEAKDVFVGDEVWTEDGWTEVKNVIEKPLRKQLYTVRTKRGVVHVTEDHSLVLSDGTEISPTEVSVGDELLHSSASISRSETDISVPEAWVMGLFAAEGSCGVYESEEWGTKESWAINNKETSLLRCAQSVLGSMGMATTIDDTIESSGSYKLRLVSNEYGSINKHIARWRNMFYDGKRKKIPEDILVSGNDVKEAFVRGYFIGDGHSRDDSANDIDEMWSKSPILAQGLVQLLRSLGYEMTIDYRTMNGRQYYRIRTVSYYRGSPTEILSIEPYSWNGDTVYDFETANGHFHAGVGDIIVHNTDGFGVCLPSADDMDEALRVGWRLESAVNDEMPSVSADLFEIDRSQNEIEIECESYSDRVFVKGDESGGVMKKYAERERWEQ